MKKDEYWKNFKLGKELDVSGRFIYNGLQNFHEMQHFAYDEEIFEFLYHISVGIERLLKIAVVLIEHNEMVNQDAFEKSLITHNHVDLLQRVEKSHKLNLSSPHKAFLALLSKFYKTARYGRYSLTAMTIDSWESVELLKFLNKGLSISIDTKSQFGITPNDVRIKRYVGKIVGKLCEEVYKVVLSEARRLNIYTYEIRPPSKAYKIFGFKKYDFEMEVTLRKELLVYFVSTKDEGNHSKFIRSMESLNFDPALEAEYIDCFHSNVKAIGIMGELEELYADEVEDIRGRMEMLKLIGSADFFFDEYDEDEHEED